MMAHDWEQFIGMFSFLFEEKGFIVKEAVGPDERSFGDRYVIAVSEDFLIRFVRDRSELSVDIASHVDPSEWYDLNLLKTHFMGKSETKSSTLEELALFLREEYDNICKLLQSLWNDNIRYLLKYLEYKRARTILGNMVTIPSELIQYAEMENLREVIANIGERTSRDSTGPPRKGNARRKKH